MYRSATAASGPSLLLLGILLLQGCSSTPVSSPVRDSGPREHRDFSHLPDAVPRHEEQTRAGNPPTYVVNGRRYTLLDSNRGYVERGYASWYGKKFHGRTTSNGEIYDMYAMTAAHKTLRIPAYVQVTNLSNGRQVVVRVNDRGPFHDNRIIDLSYAAASRLGFVNDGTAMVEVRVLEPGSPLPPAQHASTPIAPPSSTPTSPADPIGPAPAAGPALYLQLGSFISRDNAETLRARLAMNNLGLAHVQQFSVDRQQIFRVRIGPLRSSEEADRLALEVSRLGIGVPSIVID
ncbi:MAG: septal ring lytic transglycosylase RlpA family protein [Gammaproteobacteria bacterium]|nr:septal ring lytic transglycosylase RlpA family protein [Gammaproteobacteria bacterium]